MLSTTSSRDELVRSNYRLAGSLARRFARRSGWGESVEDLTQVALLGLVRAADRFDPTRRIPFSAFAATTIKGELKHYLRDRTWTVRPPRRMQDLYLRLPEAVAELGQELGRTPTFEEIGERIDVSADDIATAVEVGAMRRLTSLDAPAGGEDNVPLGGRIPSDDRGTELVEEQLEVSELLSKLPPRQRRMIQLRFIDGLTQHEIARHMSLSQAHVQRLLVRSLDQLRALATAA